MRNIILLFFLATLSQSLLAQPAIGFNYQTVLRDVTRQVLVNQAVTFQFSILQESSDGNTVYVERQDAVTNQFGLVNLIIGDGNTIDGDLEDINWGEGNYFLQVEIDPKGATDFQLMGASQLLAVPMSIWEISDEDRSYENELQELTKIDNRILLSLNGGEVILNDDDSENELQELNKNGSTISLSQNGGSVTLNDDNANNELQTINKDGSTISLSQNGGSFDLLDDDPGNEIQNINLSLESNILTIGNGTSAVNLTNYLDSPWLNAFGNIYYPGRVAIGTSQFNFADLTVGGSVDIRGGLLNVYTNSNDRLTLLGETTAGGGFFATYGSNQNENMIVSTLLSDNVAFPNHGFLSIYGAAGFDPDVTAPVRLFVDNQGKGRLACTGSKSFVEKHPTQAGKEIWYACIEGPEAATYVRGTGTLEQGETFIELPEHFQLVSNTTAMTVILTPLDATSEGLAAIEKTTRGFRVKELRNGTGNYQFDWEAKSVRKGFENYQVIQDANINLPDAISKK